MKKLLSAFLGIALLIAPLSASALVIPTGRAYGGNLTITSGTTTDNATESNITVSSASGIASTTIASVSGFSAGQYVMLYQAVGTGAGNYEFQLVRAVAGNSLFFYGTLANTYQSTGAEVVKVSEYNNVNISGGTWTAASWNGTVGGILVAFLTGSLTQSAGSITSPGGFAGGGGNQVGVSNNAAQGNSTSGTGGLGTAANANAGGGGQAGCSDVNSGGGGGNGAGGSTGGTSGCATPGIGGGTGGATTLATMVFGGGGGGGACSYNAGCINGGGGTGSGIIFIVAASSTISGGTLSAAGNAGGACSTGTGGGGGGAGAGGDIRLPVRLALNLGTSIVAAAGASGGSSLCITSGGSSGAGRIATVSAANVSGTANPTINTSSTDYVYNIDNSAITISLGTSF